MKITFVSGALLFVASVVALSQGGCSSSSSNSDACPAVADVAENGLCSIEGLACAAKVNYGGCPGQPSSPSDATCTCSSGHFRCPQAGAPYCPNDAGTHDADAGECTDGETKKLDSCNTCSCVHGSWACTGIACPVDSGAETGPGDGAAEAATDAAHD